MNTENNLTDEQKDLLWIFYKANATRVPYNKTERQRIWNLAKNRLSIPDFEDIQMRCPALTDQISKSYQNGSNIQSAVFSECVYSQTLADMLRLTTFEIASSNSLDTLPQDLQLQIRELGIVPRYIYSDAENSRYLIQAGGHTATDSAFAVIEGSRIYTIEYKEPGAKTSEPDLPKYDEDGILKVTDDFKERYPQFNAMLEEKQGLNFFDIMGSNEHGFSVESINIAVSENYSSAKPADVICTEDIEGFLVLLPSSHITMWAEVEGEIRPAGRNSYSVWTPMALNRFLREKGAVISGNTVTIDKKRLENRVERGGGGRISGYKINPLFFVRIADCSQNGNRITFSISKVKQLNPTIAGKMFFNGLKYNDAKSYYLNLLDN